jgi:hypothetical protein
MRPSVSQELPGEGVPARIDARRLAAGLLFVAAAVASAQDKGAAAAAANAQPPRVAGTIEFAAGDAMIEAADGNARLPRVGETVSEGDTIVTFAQAELHLHMEDGASLSVRENSRMKIAAYVAEGGRSDKSVLELLQGSLRSVTGWIGKFNRPAYQIKTPTATIGVRGTDHEPTYLPPGDPRGEPGAYDKVNEGRTFLQAGSQVVDIGANQAGFHPAAGAARPRILSSVPGFFRAAPNEQRFVARSREVRARLDERRRERQDAIRRTPDVRRDAPAKGGLPATRPAPGAPPVGPRGPGKGEGAASPRANAPATGTPGAKAGRVEGREKPPPPRGGRAPGPAPHPGMSDPRKAPANLDRPAKADQPRGGGKAAKQQAETGGRGPPQAGGGRHR